MLPAKEFYYFEAWVKITFSNIVKYGGFEVVQAAEVVAAFRQVGTHVYLG